MKLYDDVLKKLINKRQGNMSGILNNQNPMSMNTPGIFGNQTPGLLNNQGQNNLSSLGGLLGNIYNKAKEKVQDPDFMKSLAMINAGFRGKGLQEAMMDAAKTERLKVGKRKLVRAINTTTGQPVFVSEKEALDNPSLYRPIPQPNLSVPTEEQKAISKARGEEYTGILENSNRAYNNQNTIEQTRQILDSSSDLRTGIDANLRTQAQRVADALGIKINVQDVTSAQLLQQSTGELVLNDLQKFKGAISDGERAFAKEKNANLGQTKEGIRIRLDIMEKSGQIQQKFAEATNDWIERNKSLGARDAATGESWSQFKKRFYKENPLFDEELKQRIKNVEKLPAEFANQSNLKVINGKTYIQKDGDWFEQDTP